MKRIYCTYITIYRGNKLPPFYIGYSYLEKIQKGYRGSVASKTYKSIWDSEIKENSNLFITKIIKEHETKIEAIEYEKYLHTKLDAVKNPLYTNKSSPGPTFYLDEKTYKAATETRTKTFNDPEWIQSVGIKRAEKISKTRTSKEWKESVGNSLYISNGKLQSKTKSSLEWKNTVGKESANKCSKTQTDPNWKNVVGREKSKKVSKTQNSKEWKLRAWKTCEYCDMFCSPGNYVRWHGNNCRNKNE